MKKIEYQKLVKKYEKKESRLKNSIKAFIMGGVMGVIGCVLTDFYSYIFDISTKTASTYMIVTLIFLGCLLTCLGFFDNLVEYFGAGLFVPITGFAHSMMSSTLEYKKEGLITGIGANMFKLSGTVIIYGVISAYIFGLIRLIIGGNI